IDYSDVASDYWASESIRQVSGDEFMSGYPEGDFRPFESVSRLEVLVALVSGLSLDQPEAVQDILSTYSDQGQIPEWAAPKIAAATAGNLVVSHPNPSSLNPSQPATRAETAAMIYQALVRQGKLESVSSDYIVQPK
ncbi:MAG: S-layer homology domain-containing protein, partial [Elainellaceae cyanobacterium]